MEKFSSAHQELESLLGGLVVSCQAREDNPLHGPRFMTAVARAAALGGAAGIRANGVEDISAIRSAVNLPILGINKLKLPDGTLFITPSSRSAREVIDAGARLVAVDGTLRARPGGESLESVIEAIHDHGACALADVSTLEEGIHAAHLGADAVGTTLSGYTPYTQKQEVPDFDLLKQLAGRLSIPVFAEGRIWTADQAAEALRYGAAFVVVGTAITNPMASTAHFIQTMETVRSAAATRL